jgi:hypothetical protein
MPSSPELFSDQGYVAGQTVANAADVRLGSNGAISVLPLTTTHLVIDVYGYFTDVEQLMGLGNTALGFHALLVNTPSDGGVGTNNTAVGAQALQSNTSGGFNTAMGASALGSNTTSFGNTAVGAQALGSNTTGSNNTAMGVDALGNNTTGSNITAVGPFAGTLVSTGSNNIHIGNTGADESNTIRIGATQTSTFIAGIAGQTSAGGTVVFVNADGKLGTSTSSQR